MRIVLRYLPENSIIVDAGAHIGIDSEFFCKKFPKGMVYSLEPVSELFNVLSNNLTKYQNSVLIQGGLADFNGFTTINLSSGDSDGSSSILSPQDHISHHPGVFFTEKQNTFVQTLDDFFQSSGIERIDLLWLDLQGLEPAVLRKSPELLKRVRVIHTEVSFVETYTGVELYPSFHAYLISHDFKLIKLNKDFKDMGNALYLNLKFNQDKIEFDS